MPNYNTQGITSSAGSDPRNLGGSEGYGNPTASTSSGIMSSTSNPTANDDNNDEPSFFESIANLFSGAGADLPSDKSDDDGDSGISFYDSPMFTPSDGGSDNDTTPQGGLPFETTAADRALYEALGVDVPEVYKGKMGEEEPEPNIDMDVLQKALQPDPITVEELDVKAGDTLTSIAEEKGLPVQAVIDANPQIKNPDLIRPGEKVTLPERFTGIAPEDFGTAAKVKAPEVLSIPEALSYMGDKRGELIMKGIEKLFGLFPPKTEEEQAAKSELEYFLDAQPDSVLPDLFKYIPDAVQVQEYLKGRADRKMEGLARESAELAASERDAAGITRSLTPEEVAARNNVAGTDPRELGGAEGYGSVGTPADAEAGEGLMTRPKARPTGLSSLNTEEKNKAAQEYLGVTVDGVWGRGSTRKLAGWQYQNGLPVSGVLDEVTIKAMENPETEDPRKEITRKSVLNEAGTAPDISKVKTWAKENIKDPVRAAAFVATVEAETGGRALVEGGHTLKSAVRTFVTNNASMHEGNDLNRPLTAKGKRRKQKLEALGSNATGDEIFDFIYGPDTDAIGATLGNTSATDGSKYKGRGLVQITGKDNYQRIGDIIGVDLVNNPELVKDPKYAAAAAMAYLTLPGKDFFDGTLTSDKLARAIGHTGSAADRWTRTTALKNEMYP